MNLKKMIFINTIITFILCFATHFIYTLFPNFLTAIFFPVNESIWEHMKMIYTTILISGLIEYFILKKFNINYHNILLEIYTKALLCIPIYLLIFLPIFYNIGENMPITFIILFLSILIVNYLGSFILKSKEISHNKIISIFFIIITYIIMIYLTYKTPHTDIFFDTKEEKYGINDYLIKE